jgi:predicted kinase
VKLNVVHEAPNADAPAAGPVIVVAGPTGVGKSTVSRLVATAFDRSVHLQADDLMASVVNGWVDPNGAEAARQNEAIGGALAVSAMSLALDGYATVVDGQLFPDGAAGLAAACSTRRLACHYVVLVADIDTCWTRATQRGVGRWPLEYEPVARLHARFAELALDARHLVDATGSPADVSDAVLTAWRARRLALT